MSIIEIDEDNIEEYADIVDQDIAENMERTYFRGLVCHDPGDDSVKAAMIWELQSVEKDTDTESRIDWIYADGTDNLEPLLEAYREKNAEEEVKRSFFEIPSLDEQIGSALGGCGFDVESVESRVVRLTVDELAANPLAKKKAPDFVQSISGLDIKSYHQGVMKLLFQPDACPLEDMCYIPKTWFDQDVSCYVTTDGKVNGFLLIHEFPSGILMPLFFRASGPDASHHIAYMMIYSMQKAAEKYPGDRVVLVKRRAANIEAIVNKLFPGKKGQPATAGQRKE